MRKFNKISCDNKFMSFLAFDNFVLYKSCFSMNYRRDFYLMITLLSLKPEFNGWKTTCEKIKKQSFICEFQFFKKRFNPKNSDKPYNIII